MSTSSIRTFAVRRALLSVCFVILCFVTNPSRATVVVSNLSEPYQVGFTADGTHFATAGSFSTSAAGNYRLNTVTLPIQVNSVSGDTTELRLRADGGGVPGALIESLGSEFASQGQTLLTYNSTGSVLSANTTYWVTLGETGSGGGQNWDGTLSTAEFSPISWTIGDQTFDSVIGSGTWQQVNFGPPNSSPLFAIDATAVPEPSSVTLGIIGLAGLLVFRLGRVVRRGL